MMVMIMQSTQNKKSQLNHANHQPLTFAGLENLSAVLAPRECPFLHPGRCSSS